MAEGTAALRGAAACWSLAGDQQLLDLLQEIHQRIISKCNETNQRLENMSRGLRDASVNLQNVNNKFLALSNTQFVESRVYEDDADVAVPAGGEKEPSNVGDFSSDLAKLKQSLHVLESYHEPLLIGGDSDDSSDDGDDRLVLKPKDLYAERPLPHIIGSHAWRNKWHAGLVADESDSDSSTSKVQELEEYSDSAEEDMQPEEAQRYGARKVSSDSSLQSDAAVSVTPVRPSPSAVAAELARRLGGEVKIPVREPVYTQPEPVVRKLYKPQEPLATTIFPDEPPPLEEATSDDDIFAELHKTQPKPHSNRADDLFDFSPKPSGLEEALFGAPKVQTNQVIDRPPLFADDSETEVTETKIPAKEQSDESVKKPVGGISLFGTNKHAESIGAAILKRNRRKSSTSGDESNTEEVKVVKEVKPVKEVKEVKKERDIFDDLFAKSEKLNKKNAKPDIVQPRNVVQLEKKLAKEVKNKDVFSDIFDDIDDIFSSDIVNVKIKETKKNEKSLFSDDDDLFAEISKVNKSETDKVTPINVARKVEKEDKQKGTIVSPTQKKENEEVKKENKVLKEVKETKGLFDSDSDDGLFTNVPIVKQNISKTEKPVEYKLKDELFDDNEDDGLFTKKANPVSRSKVDVTKNDLKDSRVSNNALFDSDDELFKDKNMVKQVKQDSNPNNKVLQNMDNNEQLFGTSVSKTNQESEKPDIIKEMKIETKSSRKSSEVGKKSTGIDSIKNDLLNDDDPSEYPKESPLETSHDSFDDETPYSNQSTLIKNNTNENISINTETSKSSIDSQHIENKLQTGDMFGIPNEQTYFKENILRTTRIGLEEDSVPTDTKPIDILNDFNDDLFKTKPKVPSDTVGISQADETLEPAIVPETPDLLAAPTNKNDFSDIFDDVPPIFEKPKEPKRSKNVNALFDDDSDDEALFFKKNDAITDEKPSFSPSEVRFGIFNDEPPAIDIDFSQKATKREDVTQAQSSTKTDEIFSNLDKIDNSTTNSIEVCDSVTKESDNDIVAVSSSKTQDTTDNTNKEPKKIGKLKQMNLNINVTTLLPGASPKKKQIENTEVHTASNEELHKTDKIEPKMVKSISFDDPEILDNKLSKERAKIQVKRRPSTRRARKEAVRKSAIDFTDSSLDSSNDNSTKEEVKDKVVKTVYILNDDDIFGSAKTQKDTEHTKKHLNIVDSDEEFFKSTKPNTDNNDNVNLANDKFHIPQATVERQSSVDSNDNDDRFKKPKDSNDVTKDDVDATVQKDNQNKVKTGFDSNENNVLKSRNLEEIKQSNNSKEELSKGSENKSFLDSDDDDAMFRQPHEKAQAVLDSRNEPNLDSDEELFKNPPKSKMKDRKVKSTKSFLSSDDDDELFKAKSTKDVIQPALKSNVSSDEENLFRNKGIGTLGKVYNKTADNTKVKETHNIFDDFPAKSSARNENIKDNKKKVNIAKEDILDKTVKEASKPAVKKSILDDFSDEEDLFKSKTKLLSRNTKSLFGDDGGDDDLFGSKPAKEVKQEIPVALPAKESKAAEPVFVDPLSLFGDEE